MARDLMNVINAATLTELSDVDDKLFGGGC